MNPETSGARLPSEKVVVLGVLFGVLGSHEVATQFSGHPVHGALDGPRAVVAGLAMLLFGVYSTVLYLRKVPDPVRRPRYAFIALYVGAVATPHFEVLFGSPSRFMAVSFVTSLLLSLIAAHVLHSASLGAYDCKRMEQAK